MHGEVKEPKPKSGKKLEGRVEEEEESAEDLLREDFLENNFPNLYQVLKKELSSQEKYTSKITSMIKEKYPKLKKVFDELNKYTQEVKFKGILLKPKKREMEIGIYSAIGISSFNFLLIRAENLIHYLESKLVDPKFSEKGMRLVVEEHREFFKGKASKTQKEIFERSEELVKREARGVPEEELKPLDEELKRLANSKEIQAKAQFGEKIKDENRDVSETFANLITFLYIFHLGIEAGLKIKEETVRKYLSASYCDLTKDNIDNIIEKRKDIIKELNENYEKVKEKLKSKEKKAEEEDLIRTYV